LWRAWGLAVAAGPGLAVAAGWGLAVAAGPGLAVAAGWGLAVAAGPGLADVAGLGSGGNGRPGLAETAGLGSGGCGGLRAWRGKVTTFRRMGLAGSAGLVAVAAHRLGLGGGSPDHVLAGSNAAGAR
jgi:hypothetical protein